MRIEDNAAACDMLRKLLIDVENKIRSAYNYGFKNGTEQGRAEAIESIVKFSIENYTENKKAQEIKAESDGISCNTCKYVRTAEDELPCCECMYTKVSKYRRAESEE